MLGGCSWCRYCAGCLTAKKYACHTDASLHNANVGDHGYFYPVGAHLFGRVHPRRQSGSPGQPSLTGAYIFVQNPWCSCLDGQSMLVLTTGTLKILLMYLWTWSKSASKYIKSAERTYTLKKWSSQLWETYWAPSRVICCSWLSSSCSYIFSL